MIVGGRADRLIRVKYAEGAWISGKVLRSARATIINDVSKEKSHYEEIDALTAMKTRSLIAAPLAHKGRSLGVVEVLNPVQAERFSESDRSACSGQRLRADG